MKVNHRISFNLRGRSRALKKFNRLGIKTWAIEDMRFFDITEDDPRWPEVSKIIKKNKIPSVATADFSKEEILSAEWVWLHPVYFDEEMYPEPREEHKSWKKASFNYKDECQHCGIGLYQNAPIRLKGEPNLKGNDFLSVFWIYLIFARPEVLDTMKKNDVTGFEIFPAINHSSDTPLETIRQMKVINELPTGLIADNLTRADVERMTADNTFTHEPYPCGHIKYYGTDHVMMKYQKEVFSDCPDLVRTSEWFGTGYAAIQLTLASAKFVRLYYENNWKGLLFAPIELI